MYKDNCRLKVNLRKIFDNLQFTLWYMILAINVNKSNFESNPRLNVVNVVVRSLLFTKLNLDREQNMKKGAGVYTLNRVNH